MYFIKKLGGLAWVQGERTIQEFTVQLGLNTKAMLL